MTTFSLREAAEQAGTSKSTIWRAIKSGRMSAARTDDGGFAIDPSELFRVFQPKAGDAAEGQDATLVSAPETADETLRTRLAVADAQVAALRELVDEMRAARDDWKATATRLLTDNRPKSWWRRLSG